MADDVASYVVCISDLMLVVGSLKNAQPWGGLAGLQWAERGQAVLFMLVCVVCSVVLL